MAGGGLRGGRGAALSHFALRKAVAGPSLPSASDRRRRPGAPPPEDARRASIGARTCTRATSRSTRHSRHHDPAPARGSHRRGHEVGAANVIHEAAFRDRSTSPRPTRHARARERAASASSASMRPSRCTSPAAQGHAAAGARVPCRAGAAAPRRAARQTPLTATRSTSTGPSSARHRARRPHHRRARTKAEDAKKTLRGGQAASRCSIPGGDFATRGAVARRGGP